MGVAKAKRQRVRAEMLSTLSFSMSKTKSHIRHPDTLLLQCKRKGGMAYAGMAFRKFGYNRDRCVGSGGCGGCCLVAGPAAQTGRRLRVRL